MPGAPACGGASATCRPAARALHFVPVVLDGLRPRLGQVGDLVGVPHPQVAGTRQVSAAAATALREVRDDAVRDLPPGQERTRRAGLLARLAAAVPALPALRRLPPRQVISARRHRRVPAVAGDQPLQPRDPVLQLRDLGVLVLQQHPQPLVRLPQPPVLRAQCGRIITGHTGSPGRIGHTGTTSEPALRKQHDTPSRQAKLPGTPSAPPMAHSQGRLNAYAETTPKIPS